MVFPPCRHQHALYSPPTFPLGPLFAFGNTHVLPFRTLVPPVAPMFPMTGWSPSAPPVGAFGEHNPMMPMMPMMQFQNAPPTIVVNNYTNCTIYGSNEGANVEDCTTPAKRKSCSLEKVHRDTSKKRRRNASVPTAPYVPVQGCISEVGENAPSANFTGGDAHFANSTSQIPPLARCSDARADQSPKVTKTITKHKGVSPYKNTGFSSSLSTVLNSKNPGTHRLVGRSRKWSTNLKGFGEWRLRRVALRSKGKPIVFKLNRGGTIKFFPGICSAGQIQKMREEMENVSVFKQYQVRQCGKEPRVHALFASNGGGYQYGNVKVGSNPLDTIPFISKVAEGFAAKFELPGKEWNIGCHLVMYRNGKDSINWHADDTQGKMWFSLLQLMLPLIPEQFVFNLPTVWSSKMVMNKSRCTPCPGMPIAWMRGYKLGMCMPC